MSSKSEILKRAAKLAAKWENERGIEDISLQDAISIASNGPTPQYRRGEVSPSWRKIKGKEGFCPHCGQEH